MVGLSDDMAIWMKLSSSDIYSFIRLIWNRTALDSVILPVSMKAPPFMSKVAASGTCSTLNPICWSTTDSVARAVVLPAQGPPVRQILVIGCLLSLRAFLASSAPASSLRLECLFIVPSSCVLLFLEEVLCMTRSTLSISSFIVLNLLSVSFILLADVGGLGLNAPYSRSAFDIFSTLDFSFWSLRAC